MDTAAKAADMFHIVEVVDVGPKKVAVQVAFWQRSTTCSNIFKNCWEKGMTHDPGHGCHPSVRSGAILQSLPNACERWPGMCCVLQKLNTKTEIAIFCPVASTCHA